MHGAELKAHADTVISESLGPWLVPNRPYPKVLPPELFYWQLYTSDGGYSILVSLEHESTEGQDVKGSLVPAPVKSVLRAGWEVIDGGYVRCKLPYSRDIGLLTEAGDDEF